MISRYIWLLELHYFSFCVQNWDPTLLDWDMPSFPSFFLFLKNKNYIGCLVREGVLLPNSAATNAENRHEIRHLGYWILQFCRKSMDFRSKNTLDSAKESGEGSVEASNIWHSGLVYWHSLVTVHDFVTRHGHNGSNIITRQREAFTNQKMLCIDATSQNSIKLFYGGIKSICDTWMQLIVTITKNGKASKEMKHQGRLICNQCQPSKFWFDKLQKSYPTKIHQ